MYSNQGNVGTVVAGKCHYCNQPWVREGLCCMESSRGTMREGLVMEEPRIPLHLLL